MADINFEDVFKSIIGGIVVYYEDLNNFMEYLKSETNKSYAIFETLENLEEIADIDMEI